MNKQDKTLLAAVAAQPFSNVYDDGCLRVEFEHHYVAYAGRQLLLPNKEFLILSLLLRHAEEFVPPTMIWKRVWGAGRPLNVNALRVRIHRLREYFEPSRLSIESAPGIGYRLTLRSRCGGSSGGGDAKTALSGLKN